ncbi:MAG: creatininase [Solirubrobacteraceae bacterium]
METKLMEDMTWEEARDAAAAELPVVLSIGATEQHGPHLPLSTDCIIPVGIALRAASDVPLIVAPPIRYGAKSRALSGGGETFPGTISLRGSTLIETLRDVLVGLGRSGFRKACVQNWHFENAGFLWEACDLAVESNQELKILLLENPFPSFTDSELADLYPEGFPGWDVEHASIMETSIMLSLRPDLVRTDRIVDDQAARHPSWDVVPAPPEFIPRSGVLWRPSLASADLGERFLAATAGRLAEAIRTELS